MASRSKENLDSVITEIKKGFPHVAIQAVIVDLSSQSSGRRAAEEINKLAQQIDVLVNNAGITASERRYLSSEGIEMPFATNHIGQFLLTNLVLGKLQSAAKRFHPGSVRIVNVSSWGHRFSPVRFSDYNLDGR